MIGSRVYSASVPLLLAFVKHIARLLSRVMKACFDVETPPLFIYFDMAHRGPNTLFILHSKVLELFSNDYVVLAIETCLCHLQLIG